MLFRAWRSGSVKSSFDNYANLMKLSEKKAYKSVRDRKIKNRRVEVVIYFARGGRGKYIDLATTQEYTDRIQGVAPRTIDWLCLS